LYIKPVSGVLTFDGKQYAGSLLLIADHNKGYIVNRLDIEEYIYSVLYFENLPSWPLEVHKVLAVASRSYLMVKILEAEKKNRPFHIKNTNIHQTYNGLHDNVRLQQAVEETRGLVLMHNKKPIIAMFDACCGGVVPADIEGVVDFQKAPYLARTYACTFCKKYRVFAWQANYSALDIKNMLKKIKIFVQSVHDVRVTQRDKAGLVRQIVVSDGKKVYTLTGKQWYSLFSSVKSFCFSINKSAKNRYVVEGRGYGHHFGLCQKGARALVDEGWNFKKILQFYYPGTTFMHLKEK
jgi:stage II sporulation protein D